MIADSENIKLDYRILRYRYLPQIYGWKGEVEEENIDRYLPKNGWFTKWRDL